MLPSATTFLYSDSVTNKLYVAGQFDQVDGNYVRGIASWDGTAWSTMGDGLDSCGNCGSLVGATWSINRFNNELYVGGDFRWAGDINAKHLARWNGSTWNYAPGGQPNSRVTDIQVLNNELYICGAFDSLANLSTG